MRYGLEGISVGIYEGHKRGEYFLADSDTEVWRCDSSSKQRNEQTATLIARFRYARDAREFVRRKGTP